MLDLAALEPRPGRSPLGRPTRLERSLEECLGRKAIKDFMPMQPGDVPSTYADIDDLYRDVGFRPSTSIEDGVGRFVSWYRSYYRV